MRNGSYSIRLFGMELAMLVMALVFLVPFYFILSNSFKAVADILGHTADLPNALHWGNYKRAWSVLNFPSPYLNSLWITVISVIGLTVLSSMCAYRLVRRPTAVSKIILLLFVTAMVIPIQSIMIPLVEVMSWLKLINTIPGIIVCYLGLGIAFSTFLYHGFVKTISLEIEEAALIDGCNGYSLFWRIVFPLLKPMVVTVVLLNTLHIWNEFLLARLILLKPELRTIQLAINSLFGEYRKQWDLALPALVMGMTPMIVFFLALQRHIVEGITSGATKG